MNQWFSFIGIIGASILTGFLTRVLIFSWLGKVFAKTKTPLDDLALNSLRRHVPLWFLIAGTILGAHWVNLHLKFSAAIEKIAIALLFISISFVIANFLIGFVRIYANKLAVSFPATSLTENLIKIVVFGLGLLLILSNLGISITPLLTALGVGSLAVALALQDTLSNLFAGIYIVINRQIQAGDYIRLDSGQVGYVTDIGWRSTRIRELPNNVIIVPNAKLSQTIVTNYYQPEKEMSVVFQVGVSYDSDLKKVESVTVEVAKETLKEVQGGVPTFEPFIRYHTFGDSSINFSVILRVREFTDRYLVTHEFMKRLHARYKQEGITIPFPQRVMHVEKG